MKEWHTCNTTHCWAGWAVHLAGEKGNLLECETSTVFAAMQILKASSPHRVSPCQFYGSNEETLEAMRKLAELEANDLSGK